MKEGIHGEEFRLGDTLASLPDAGRVARRSLGKRRSIGKQTVPVAEGAGGGGRAKRSELKARIRQLQLEEGSATTASARLKARAERVKAEKELLENAPKTRAQLEAEIKALAAEAETPGNEQRPVSGFVRLIESTAEHG